MRVIRYGAAIAAALMLVAQPCAAAEDNFRPSTTEARATAFAGLRVRLPLAAKAKPTARLRFSTGYSLRDPSSGAVRTTMGDGFEFGAGKRGMPALFVNGTSASQLQDRLGVSGGSGKTLLIVGGVLVVAVVVALAAGGAGLGDTCPTVGGDRSHCINP